MKIEFAQSKSPQKVPQKDLASMKYSLVVHMASHSCWRHCIEKRVPPGGISFPFIAKIRESNVSCARLQSNKNIQNAQT